MTDLDFSDFFVHPYRMKRLNGYYSRMNKDNDYVVFDDHVADVLRRQGFSFQETPRSIYRVEKLFEALVEFGSKFNHSFDRNDSHVRHGISLARACFSRPRDMARLSVLPMTVETLKEITSNPGGSPGLTNYGCSKAESQTRALERSLQVVHGVKKPEPCLAFARTQFNEKTRLVWGYPYSMTFIEGLIAFPILQTYKKGFTPLAFASTSMNLGTKLVVASYHCEWAYSLDMSHFDSTISSGLIHEAFNILKTWYDPHEIEPVSGKSVKELFDVIEKYFIYTPIVMPDGNVYKGKDHGVPSGSYFTQLVDSIVNVIICGAISHRYSLNVNRREIFVLGDDLLFWSNRKIDLDKISRFANDMFGVRVHGPEKSHVYHYDETIHYLGRDWSNGLPSLPVEDIIARMVFPERFRKYSNSVQKRRRELRMLMLSYAATYRNAWRIATKALDAERRNVALGCANTDVNTYCSRPAWHSDEVHIDPYVTDDWLSGLDRYRKKYMMSKVKGDIPITALQYWL